MQTDVDVLIDFLNTYDPGSDEEELSSNTDAYDWFAARRLPTRGLKAAEARKVRSELRACAEGKGTLSDALKTVPLRAWAGADGLELESDHPLGPLVATAVRLSYEGRWDRLKLCVADTCRFAFYDGSRNRSGRWCSMAECGNRAKTRTFRERHKGHKGH